MSYVKWLHILYTTYERLLGIKDYKVIWAVMALAIDYVDDGCPQ